MTPSANGAALISTVALLMVTAYFFFGSVPLLVLKLDDPVDAKFIRSFYSTYYQIAFLHSYRCDLELPAFGATRVCRWCGGTSNSCLGASQQVPPKDG